MSKTLFKYSGYTEPRILASSVRNNSMLVLVNSDGETYLAKTSLNHDISDSKRLENEFHLIHKIYTIHDAWSPGLSKTALSHDDDFLPSLPKNDGLSPHVAVDRLGAVAQARIACPIKLVKSNDQPILIFPYQDQIPLINCNNLSTIDVIKIGFFVAEGLEVIHKARVGHFNLSPESILLRMKDKSIIGVQLIDFRFANTLVSGNRYHPELDQCKTYSSPEQTGRLDKKPDHRSDLYSLGIILQELLSEKEVTSANDAKKMPSLKDAPIILSTIIEKLTSKDWSCRYQLTAAVKLDMYVVLDLARTLKDSTNEEELFQALKSLDNFQIASRDRSSLSVFSDERIIRSTALEELRQIHSECVERQCLVVVAISSPPLTGKKTLLKQFGETIKGRNNIIIFAEADQVGNPFPSILEQLTKVFVSESSEKLLAIRDLILRSIGRSNLGMLLSYFVAAKPLMGNGFKTSDTLFDDAAIMQNLPPLTEQLISILTQNLESVVIYIPEISSQLGTEIFRAILLKGSCKSLMLVKNHQASELDRISEDLLKDNYKLLIMEPLAVNDIANFLASILKPTKGDLIGLANVFFQKTRGHAFFVKELVSYCANSNLIRFDENTYSWTWDIEKLSNLLKITSNVEEELCNEFVGFDAQKTTLLQICAILGNRCDLNLLKEATQADIEKDLEYLCSNGFLNISCMAPAPIKQGRRSSNAYTRRATITTANLVPTHYEISSSVVCESIISSMTSKMKESLCTTLSIAGQRLKVDFKHPDYAQILKFFNECVDEMEEFSQLDWLVELNMSSIGLRGAEELLPIFRVIEKAIKKNEDRFWKDSPIITFDAYVGLLKARIQTEKVEDGIFQENIQFLRGKYTSDVQSMKLRLLEFYQLYEKNQHHAVIESAKAFLSESQFFDISQNPIENLLDEIEAVIISQSALETWNRIVSDSSEISKIMQEIAFMQFKSYYILNGVVDFDLAIQTCAFILNNGGSMFCSSFFFGLATFFIKPNNGVRNEMFQWASDIACRLHAAAVQEACLVSVLAAVKCMDIVWTSKQIEQMLVTALDLAKNSYPVFLPYIISIYSVYQFSSGKPILSIVKTLNRYSAEKVDPDETMLFKGFLSPASEPLSFLESRSPSTQYQRCYSSFLYSCVTKSDTNIQFLAHETFMIDHATCMSSLIDLLLLKISVLVGQYHQKKDLQKSQENLTLLNEISDSTKIIKNLVVLQTSKELNCKLLIGLAMRESVVGTAQSTMRLFEESIDAAIYAGNLFINAWANEIYGEFLLRLDCKLISYASITSAMKAYTELGSMINVVEIEQKYCALLKKLSSSEAKHNSELIFTKFDQEQAETTTSDLLDMMEINESINKEKNLEDLLRKISDKVIIRTNATKVVFALSEDSKLIINSVTSVLDDGSRSHGSKAIDAETSLIVPLKIVYYVWRMGETINSHTDRFKIFKNDEYLIKEQPRSVACIPIFHQEKVTGVLYLENALQKNAFSDVQIDMVTKILSTTSVGIQNARLLKKNEELAKILHFGKPELPAFSYDAPIQRIIDQLHSLKAKFEFDPLESSNIDSMIETLYSEDLYKAELEFGKDQAIDGDTKRWLESTLVTTEYVVPDQSYQPQHAQENISSFNVKNDVRKYLDIDQLDLFDMFVFREVCDQQPLFYVTMDLLEKSKLLEALNINYSSASVFLQRIEAAYHPLPYHNSSHAADLVKQIQYLFLNDVELLGKMQPWESFSVIIAGAIHDVDHPGVNNNFLMHVKHPLAILYNDVAILESHHLATAFHIARAPEANIFANQTPEHATNMRKLIIQLVLATDISQHFHILSKFKGKVSSNSLRLEDMGDRHLVLEVLIKLSDLSNPTRPHEQSLKWTRCITEEFFLQGDRERELGLPISQFMDRHTPNISKSQVGFIDVLVAPLYDIWSVFHETPFSRVCISTMRDNRNIWKVWLDNNSFPHKWMIGETRNDDILDMPEAKLIFGKATQKFKTVWSMGSTHPRKISTSVVGSLPEMPRSFHSPRTKTTHGLRSEKGRKSTTVHSRTSFDLPTPSHSPNPLGIIFNSSWNLGPSMVGPNQRIIQLGSPASGRTTDDESS